MGRPLSIPQPILDPQPELALTTHSRYTHHASIPVRLKTEDFPRFAFHQHLKGPATYFTIGSEALGSNAGIDDQLEMLAAKRALNAFRNLHRRKLLHLPGRSSFARDHCQSR